MDQERREPYRTSARSAVARIETEWIPAPAQVAGAQSERELLELLSSTLRALYPDLLRCEVYFADERSALVPAARFGIGHCAGGPVLLNLLRSQLVANGHRPGVARAHLCRARPGAKRGSLMGALLLDGHAVIGGIVLEVTPADGFTDSDLAALEGVAGLLSLSLQRLRAGERDRRHAWMALDRKSASGVQRRLMGGSLPDDIGVTVDAEYLPALDVGGDFYELADLGDGTIGGAIGDVSGKGVSAALIMSRVSSDLRRALRSGVCPSSVLENVNASLTELDSETFVTLSCIRLDARHRKLTVANAGHLPLLVRRVTGEVFTFGRPSGTPLGMTTCDYIDEEIALEPRDIVVLMTDGLLDALRQPRDRMGTKRLASIVRSAPHDPKLVNARLLEAANQGGSGRPFDDVTLVTLQLAS